MNDGKLRLSAPQPARMTNERPRPIGHYLVESGTITTRDLVLALVQQQQWDAPLGEILLAMELVQPDDILNAVAQQHDLHSVDLTEHPPNPDLLTLLAPQDWLRNRVVPWMQLGDTLLVATARPDQVDEFAGQLPQFETVLAVVAREEDILHCIAEGCGDALAHRAERRVAPQYSCRVWQHRSDRS